MLSEHLSSFHGTGVVTGSGTLGGNTANLIVTGTETTTVTFFSHSLRMTVPSSVPFSAKLPVTSATSTLVTGDIAVLSRRAQRGAGFATNERGTYRARRVSRCTL